MKPGANWTLQAAFKYRTTHEHQDWIILWQLDLLHRNGSRKNSRSHQQTQRYRVDQPAQYSLGTHRADDRVPVSGAGYPTWDYGELQEDWESNWDAIDSLDFTGKQVAIYGLGDQIGYPEWFQDALGYLWVKMVNLGASTVGNWPNQGYSFEQSKALTEDGQFFVGLPLDDENQFELTDDYIAQWSQQILTEFGLA